MGTYLIRAQVASICSVLEQSVFSTTMNDHALISKLSMAVGSTTIDDTACEVFEAMVPIWDINASAYLIVDRMA